MFGLAPGGPNVACRGGSCTIRGRCHYQATERWNYRIAIHLAMFAAGILIPVLLIVTVMLINTARLWRDDALARRSPDRVGISTKPLMSNSKRRSQSRETLACRAGARWTTHQHAGFITPRQEMLQSGWG